MQNKRIHIKPDDVLADIDEIADGSEPRSRCKLYITPYDNEGINEACEANYYVGNRVPYHEHTTGFETFLIDGGVIEVHSLGMKAPAKKGDLVHIIPYTPHSIHALADNSIWRAFHQGLWLTPHMVEERELRDRHWDLAFDPEFRIAGNKRKRDNWVDYQFPEFKDAPPEKIPAIRLFDAAIAQYDFEGISLRLKVGRWETRGVKEVWQIHLSTGYKISWGELHPFTHLYDVFSGSVKVSLEGMEPFTANARDLLHIPKCFAGSIEALEETVLLDVGCQGFLTRFMDEVITYREREPAKLKDKAFIKETMVKNDYHVTLI